MNITSGEFVRSVRDAVVLENTAIYKQLFSTTQLADVTDPYWKQALALYKELDEPQRNAVLSLVRQVMVDTVSNVLAVLDGSIRIEPESLDIEVTVNGNRINGSLQDEFLALEEDK
jgi:hypothetical protein